MFRASRAFPVRPSAPICSQSRPRNDPPDRPSHVLWLVQLPSLRAWAFYHCQSTRAGRVSPRFVVLRRVSVFPRRF